MSCAFVCFVPVSGACVSVVPLVGAFVCVVPVSGACVSVLPLSGACVCVVLVSKIITINK